MGCTVGEIMSNKNRKSKRVLEFIHSTPTFTRRLQDTLRQPQDPSKTLKIPPRQVQDRQKISQDMPRCSRNGPKMGSDSPKCAKLGEDGPEMVRSWSRHKRIYQSCCIWSQAFQPELRKYWPGQPRLPNGLFPKMVYH